jgi:lysophospholipase L1-like esterase
MDRKWELTHAYAEMVKEVSKELDVPVVDAWDLIWKAAGEKTEALPMFLSDGLHLTREGYEIVYAELIKIITRDHPQLHYDNLPMVFPS